MGFAVFGMVGYLPGLMQAAYGLPATVAGTVILPLVHDKTLHYRNPWVTNVYVHPAFGLYDVQAMGLTSGGLTSGGLTSG